MRRESLEVSEVVLTLFYWPRVTHPVSVVGQALFATTQVLRYTRSSLLGSISKGKKACKEAISLQDMKCPDPRTETVRSSRQRGKHLNRDKMPQGTH